MPQALPFIPQQASRRREEATPIASAYPAMRRRRGKKTALNAAFLNATPSRCENRRARVGAVHGSSPSWRRDRGGHAAENIFAKLLTHRKSVIRFRPSRRFLRKQVSRVIATISKTKRPPTRALGMTDAGFASPTKTQTPSRYRTRAVCDAGVFSSAPTNGANRHGPNRPGLPPSVPTRLARRRLPAGPTPAAFHCNWAL